MRHPASPGDTTNPSCWQAATASSARATSTKTRCRQAVKSSCWAARPCSSASAAARRHPWLRAQAAWNWTLPRYSGTTRKYSAAARKSSTSAGRWAMKTRYCPSTTWAPAACPTRCRNWCTRVKPAPCSTCARCTAPTGVCLPWNCGVTKPRSATCWPLPQRTRSASARSANGSGRHMRSSARPMTAGGCWSPTGTTARTPSTCLLT